MAKTFVNRNENVVTLQTETETTPFPYPLTSPSAVDLFDIPREGARGEEGERQTRYNTAVKSL